MAGPLRWVALGMGAALLVAIGWIGLSGLFGSKGGAESPEELVTALADAVNAKDPAALIPLFSPEETRRLLPLLKDVEERAGQVEVAAADQPYAGLDVQVRDLQTMVSRRGEDVAVISVTGGRLSGGYDTSAMSDALKTTLAAFGVDPSQRGEVDLAAVAENSYRGVEAVAVRRDERWYVSPMYTAAALLLYGAEDPTFSRPTTWPEPVTEATPKDAVIRYLETGMELDRAGLVARTAPGEAAWAHDYGSFLDEQLNSSNWSAEFAAPELRNLQVTEKDLGDGMIAVVVDAAQAAWSNYGSRVSLDVQGNCVDVRLDGERSGKPVCGLWAMLTGNQWVTPSDSLRFTAVAVQTGEGWTVSPVTSLAETARSALPSIGKHQVGALLPAVGDVAAVLAPGQGVDVTIPAHDYADVKITIEKAGRYDITVDSNVADLGSQFVLSPPGSDPGWFHGRETLNLEPGEYRLRLAPMDATQTPRVNVSLHASSGAGGT